MTSQLALGLHLRDEGVDRVLAAEEEKWRQMATDYILRRVRAGYEVTAEDVRRVCGDPHRVNSIGGIFARLSKRGAIRILGYRAAERASRHGARVALWGQA